MTNQEITKTLEELFILGVNPNDAIEYFKERDVDLNQVTKLLLKEARNNE